MKEKRNFIPINIAILSVSDTRSLANDSSGDLLQKKIKSSGHKLVGRFVVIDQIEEIVAALEKWINLDSVDVILSIGGTGLTGRDVSVEAHRQLYDKEIDAFGTVFTNISMKKIGTSALQSRACAGISRGKYLFALPGSPSACKDAWDEILVYQLDYRNKPCNLVEILPRLKEVERRK